MSRVVVVGGGFAGLSQAARLAKLRHDVVLLESSSRLGGQLNGHTLGDHTWHLTPPTFTLPGVLRDLFRKSGREVSKVLEMETTAGRRHVFADKSVLDLPFGNRADQSDAVTALLGADPWSPWVDALATSWDSWRRGLLESVDPPTPQVRRAVAGRRRLTPVAKRKLKDERLRSIVLDEAILDGHVPSHTPAAVMLQHYVERNFGRWQIAGGPPALADALTTRMEERRVDVRLDTPASALHVTDGRVTGVVTDEATIPADVVVWCAPRDPAPLPPTPGVPIIPAARTLVRLGASAPDLPPDLFTHGDPPLHLWHSGGDRWTIAHHNAEDPLRALVRVGIDLRDHVIERHELTPPDLVGLTGWGWQWHGWHTARTRPSTALGRSVYFAGANARPGPSLEMIGSATAAIAGELGKA